VFCRLQKLSRVRQKLSSMTYEYREVVARKEVVLREEVVACT
jgi:hypothetical protein